ncbi:MAG: acetylxylan esterase [Acidobacteriales bacterium]|nr:acetylxylan esterase [Terriglobales bacterium]
MNKVRSLSLLLALCVAAEVPAQVQESLRSRDLQVLTGTPLEKQYEEMLQNYLQDQAAQLAAKGHDRMRAAQSPADFGRWQEETRRRFLELIGGLPTEKTPLNVRLTGEVRRDGYTIRKVIFESRPEFYVTANLYVPAIGTAPFPAVLAPCGHSLEGKAADTYQRLFIGLVKHGYVVLAYDALSQGERMQFWDFVFQHRGLVDKSNEHGLLGIRQMLLGQNLARELIWDGLRSLDYLTSLPEVDAARIGVTGNSGGGALTTYIALLDRRVKAASIVTFLSSIPKKIEARDMDSEADPEQDIQGLLGAGIDHAELVAMIAPRPVLIGAALRDFFPIEGTRQTYGELQKVYARLGASERLKMVAFDHEHKYSQPLREATTAWFDRWLKGQENEVHEPIIEVEQESTLWCTPTGQVVSSFGGKRLLDIHQAEAKRLAAELAKRRLQASFRRELAGKVRERLGLSSAPVEVRARALGEARSGDVIIEKLVLETEPGIVVPVRVLRPRGVAARRPTVVYLRDRDAAADDPYVLETLARRGWGVMVADVRGFGETTPHRQVADSRMYCFHPRDGKDADFAYAASSLGRPLLGMRVWDALHVMEYAQSRADVDPKRVVLVGRGWAGLTALFAAVLDGRVARIAVEGVPISYAELFSSEMYAQPASLVLPGALRDFDLEDVYGALAPRPLLVLNPEDAQTKKMFRAQAERALEPVRRNYEADAAAGHLQVAVAPSEREIEAGLTGWIGAAKTVQ